MENRLLGLRLATICSIIVAASAVPASRAASLADFVNPLIGTAGDGQTFPATGVPFGMTQWTPQTRDGEAKCVAPYYQKDTRIQGFRGSHFPSGSCTQDCGSVTIMPATGPLKLSAAERASVFERSGERARPYRYDVTLDDFGIRASLAATSRAAILEFRYPAAAEAWILVQANSRRGEGQIRIDVERREITGCNPVHRLYAGSGKPAGFSGCFVARFDRPFGKMGVWSGSHREDGAVSQDGVEGAPGAYIGFATKDGEVLRVKVGTSFTGIEEARRNLDAEIPAWSLDEVAERSRTSWDGALARIEVRGASDSRRRVFYTALYHALLLPRTFSDASGTYPAFAGSGHTETARGFTYYCDFSLWDTFRSEHPLLTIIDPKRAGDMVESLVAKGRQGGWLPIFPAWNSYTQEMIGDHAIAVIVDAYLKGIRGFDAEEAYRLMRRNAMETPASPEAYADGRGRRALASYLKYGYIPLEDPVREAFHKGEQVSRTLEYAYDDWALSRMAGALGKTDDEQLFLARARNYRNVIDPATGFARGRHADGTWDSPFDPAGKYPYITEGLPFQYTFFVPQDIEGLISTDRWPRWIHRQTRPAVQREALRSRKRAQPPYRLLIRLRRRTLEDRATGSPNHGRAVSGPAGRDSRKRRLRPDVRLVRDERARVLFGGPRHARLPDRDAAVR
jgi:predicted alpha-1,2-mannosidase